MVDYVSDVGLLLKGIRKFAFSGKAPKAIADQLQSLVGADADVIFEAAELLYAHYGDLNVEGKRVMAELFNYAHHQHFTTFNREGRSETIVKNVAKDLGDVKGKVPSPDKWPDPVVTRTDGSDWRHSEKSK